MKNPHVKDQYDQQQESTEQTGRSQRWLHPLSGIVILALDWLLFSGTVVTAGTGTLVTSLTGFLAGGLATLWFQRRFADDPPQLALGKGLLAGIAVGIPFPIFGTLLGGVVLTLSGLDKFARRR